MNPIQGWMELINTVDRAKKLRQRLDRLESPPLDETFGPEPLQCPTTVLFGAEVSRLLYADPNYRPALDAWDTGMVEKSDLWKWCLAVENGQYQGPTFYPDAAWREKMRVLTKRNASQAAWLWQTQHQPSEEYPTSNARGRRLA